jgi:hypothetical protein
MLTNRSESAPLHQSLLSLAPADSSEFQADNQLLELVVPWYQFGQYEQ